MSPTQRNEAHWNFQDKVLLGCSSWGSGDSALEIWSISWIIHKNQGKFAIINKSSRCLIKFFEIFRENLTKKYIDNYSFLEVGWRKIQVCRKNKRRRQHLNKFSEIPIKVFEFLQNVCQNNEQYQNYACVFASTGSDDPGNFY